MIYKNVRLINGPYALMLEDDKGVNLRSIIHFGGYTQKLNKNLFKGKKELLYEELDFDELAKKYCSPYGVD